MSYLYHFNLNINRTNLLSRRISSRRAGLSVVVVAISGLEAEAFYKLLRSAVRLVAGGE